MFAVVYIPEFSLRAVLRHEPAPDTEPVALVDGDSAKPEILQCNAAARRHGVAPGLTASQATARCPHLKIKTRSPAQEQSASEILLQTAYAFTPNLEATAPGVCTMDLKGLSLEKPEAARAWAEKIRQRLTLLHLTATIGLAPTPALALLAARATDSVCMVENAGDFAVRLPLAALEPPPETLEILRRWGIRSIGQLLALGREEVGERLGPEGLELFERVTPDAARPLRLASPPEQFSEQIEFETEIETAAPLLFALRRFVEQLSRRLETAGMVVAEFQLQLGLSSGASYERFFKIPSPTGNVETLFRALQTHLETVRTDSPIVRLQLSATPARPEQHQFGFFESTLRDPNQFAETLARLTALLGPDHVGMPVLESTHKPDAFRLQPPDFDAPKARATAPAPAAGLSLRRFRPPTPAHFEFRQEKPALIRSDIFTGAIAAARGPFFSSGNWWDDTRWAREEWDVETSDGSLLRIFRCGDGCFVEGVYD